MTQHTQLEAQLDLFRTLTTHALDSAGQLAALQLRASRAAVEQTAGVFRQLLEARDPRQWQAMFSHGRDWFGLAVPAGSANLPASYAQAVEQASIAADAATTIGSEIAAAAVDIGAAHAEAALDAGTAARVDGETAAAAVVDGAGAGAGAGAGVGAGVGAGAAAAASMAPAASEAAAQAADLDAAIDLALADDVPPAAPTPLARALHELAPAPAAVSHPLASSVPLQAEGKLELPRVAPSAKSARAGRRK